ncbi:sensor histidine kinase, partial [Leucobacter sp. M11]|uniref:sensor histidine kinase n=1 Tax=Leucobacter sp. M11 TaxID=2993565 RepID=UPI002D7F7A27
GGAYGWSAAQRIQQQASAQLIGDLSYFATGARQALRAGDPEMIDRELRRYAELYGATAQVFDRSGTLWAGTVSEPGLDDEAEGQIRLALSGRRGEPVPAAFPWTLRETVIVEPVFDDGRVFGAVRIAASPEASQRAILTQWGVLLLGGSAVILALIWAVYRLASWVLKPLHRVDSAMAAIEHGEMGARISDDTGPPEVQRMVRMFNQMAEEIERVMTRQQEFVMNASHELRNPLGALLMRVEYLATGLDEGWNEDVEHAREEGRRMSRILDTLLNVARVGKSDTAFAAVDLTGLVAERAAAWQDRGVGLGVTVRAGGGPAILSVTDRTAVESALDAILDNALKFAPEGTAVDVSVRERDGEHVIA